MAMQKILELKLHRTLWKYTHEFTDTNGEYCTIPTATEVLHSLRLSYPISPLILTDRLCTVIFRT